VTQFPRLLTSLTFRQQQLLQRHQNGDLKKDPICRLLGKIKGHKIFQIDDASKGDKQGPDFDDLKISEK
jgi:hypothetical protein